MRTARLCAVALAAVSTAVLAGCSGSSDAYCDALTEDGVGASLFSPYVAWGSGPSDAESRIAAMYAVGDPPADLEGAWDTWYGALEDVRDAEAEGGSFTELIASMGSGDAAEASSTLSSHFTDTCR